MSNRTPEEEKLYQDTRKVVLECAALERGAKTELLKTTLALLAAFAFVFSFALDRYKVAEQRKHDRKVAIATEFDDLLSKTLASITEARPNTLVFRLNVQAYKERLQTLTKKSSSLARGDEMALFLAESIGLAEQLLKSSPEQFEFTQWTNAIAAEATWTSRERALTPDFELQFGKEVADGWKALREKALAALHNKFSLLDSTDPKKLSDFREVAAEISTPPSRGTAMTPNISLNADARLWPLCGPALAGQL